MRMLELRERDNKMKLLAGLTSLAMALCASTLPARAQTNIDPPRQKQSADLFKLLRLDGNLVRWRSAQGNDTAITYRLVDGFQAFEGARNCRKMTTVETLSARSHLEATRFREALSAAFAMWEEVADLKFREARPGENANIVIGAQQEPEGWAFADVFYDTSSDDEFKPISLALICLNPARSWKVGFDGDLKVYDLRYTLAHEIGHAIGLDHPNGGGQIMGYRYEERFSGLQAGDASGAVALYGIPRLSDSGAVTGALRSEPSSALTPSNPTSRALKPKPD